MHKFKYLMYKRQYIMVNRLFKTRVVLKANMDEKGSREGSILIKFAQKLAGNEKKHRTLAMKKLRKWLIARSQASHGKTPFS